MSSREGTPGENFELALIRSGYEGVPVWDPVMERETRVRKLGVDGCRKMRYE